MPDVLDEFVINYTLQRLQSELDQQKNDSSTYFTANDNALVQIGERITDLEESETETTGSINSLYQLVQGLEKGLKETINELNKTKMLNLKQEMVIRTLHNLKMFEAHDMFTDTFVDGDGIDWDKSIRPELLAEFQAVGKTRSSTALITQTSAPNYMLVSKNGSSDDAVQQTFVVDKTRDIDKVSVYVEAYNESTWQPLIATIRDSHTGIALTTANLTADQAVGGWADIDLPAYTLTGGKEYYVEFRTNDLYGYKIGMDTIDRYLAGTSFGRFNNVWTDNNYDIAFKIWCFPANDENDAIIYTKKRTFITLPELMVFEKEDTVIAGGIIYHVSRDNGQNWKLLQPGIETDLNDLPEGKDLILRATITGDSRINAWGYVVKRSEV